MLVRYRKERGKRHVYEYKDAFSIGTCPNIEVEIDIMDKTPFFIRPYYTKGEDKNILDKEIKRLCYFGILQERTFGILQPSDVN